MWYVVPGTYLYVCGICSRCIRSASCGTDRLAHRAPVRHVGVPAIASGLPLVSPAANPNARRRLPGRGVQLLLREQGPQGVSATKLSNPYPRTGSHIPQCTWVNWLQQMMCEIGVCPSHAPRQTQTQHAVACATAKLDCILTTLTKQSPRPFHGLRHSQ
jgi:hypothetical protein